MKSKISLKLDYSLAMKRVIQDMRDEWFPDPLLHKDILELKKIHHFFSSNKNAFLGEKAEQFNLPKSGFTLRYSLETSIYDRVLYQAIVDKLIEKYDPLFSERVYNHRLNPKRGIYLFNNGVDAWKKFIREINAYLKNTKKVLLVADIQNYFEFISIDVLRDTFFRLNRSRDKTVKNLIEILVLLLHKWSPNKTIGIPQNQDPSSFLANVYLHPVDKKMLSRGFNYFRYMDDIRIICKDEYHARRALKELVIELRKVRLNVNPKKTKILKQDDPEYHDFMPLANRTIEEIDALFKQRKYYGIRRALPKLRDYTHKLINESKTGEREFRFCINRLEKVARCQAFDFDFTGITGPVIDLLISQPWSTDSVVRLIRCIKLEDKQIRKIKEFLTDRKKNIYGWQGYLVWQLITMLGKMRKENDRKLRKFARNILDKKWKLPMKAGAILYLGACGTKRDRHHILRNFSRIRSRLLYRSVIIATQEMSKRLAHIYIYPYVSGVLKDACEYIRDPKFKTSYFEPLPPLRPRQLFDDLPNMYAV